MGQQCCSDAKVDNKAYNPRIDRPQKVRNSGQTMHLTQTGEQFRNTNENSNLQLGYEATQQ